MTRRAASLRERGRCAAGSGSPGASPASGAPGPRLRGCGGTRAPDRPLAGPKPTGDPRRPPPAGGRRRHARHAPRPGSPPGRQGRLAAPGRIVRSSWESPVKRAIACPGRLRERPPDTCFEYSIRPRAGPDAGPRPSDLQIEMDALCGGRNLLACVHLIAPARACSTPSPDPGRAPVEHEDGRSDVPAAR